MSDNPEVPDLTIFDGGIMGRGPRFLPLRAAVGASIGQEFNAIAAGLIAVACFRVDNIRFRFSSSFIEPTIQPDLARLGALLTAHPPASRTASADPALSGSPLSVFGHADPTGDDDYNKALSGRRARAVFALLVRDAGAWNELYDHVQGDDKWGLAAIQKVLGFLGRENESAQSFDRDAGKRKTLFLDYMVQLCGSVLPQLERSDFLGGGTDAKGKADFQGCGEFNPILIFSTEQQSAFARQKDKSARDAANAENRRVMVLIFRDGTRIDPSKWPCPRATEGTAACHKRFWSDGEARRTRRLPDAERRFEAGRDTFACRFYQRLSERSPCERVLKTFVFRVRLYTGFGKAIPNAPFSVSIQSRDVVPIDRADAQGVITVKLRDVLASSDCTIRWGLEPTSGQPVDLFYSRTIFIVEDEDRSEEGALKKLKNIGYEDGDAAENILGFQFDYGHLTEPPLDPTGELDDRTAALIHRVYEQAADELRQTTLS